MFNKKKKAHGPLVWMIQRSSTVETQNPLFLGVCKDQIVTVSDWKVCFRFSDINAGGIFLYWLLQTGRTKDGEFQVVPVELPGEGVK